MARPPALTRPLWHVMQYWSSNAGRAGGCWFAAVATTASHEVTIAPIPAATTRRQLVVTSRRTRVISEDFEPWRFPDPRVF